MLVSLLSHSMLLKLIDGKRLIEFSGFTDADITNSTPSKNDGDYLFDFDVFKCY